MVGTETVSHPVSTVDGMESGLAVLEAFRDRLVAERSAECLASAVPGDCSTPSELWAEAEQWTSRFAEQLADTAQFANPQAMAKLLAVQERLRRGLEASMAALWNTIDERDAYFVEGHTRPSGFVQASVDLSDYEVTRRKWVAAAVKHLPQVAEGLAAGTFGVAHAAELGRLLCHKRIPTEQVVAAAGPLMEHAGTTDYASFRQLTLDFERAADADGAAQDAEANHRNRDANFAKILDAVLLAGRFGTAQGTVLAEIFERFVDAEFQSDWDEAKQVYGDDVCVELLARTDAQRRADAMQKIFEAAATAPVDGNPVEIVVNLVCDQATFESTATKMAGGTPPPDSPAGTRRFCRTLAGTPIDPRDAVTAAIIGHVRRVVVGGDGVIINMGRKTRLFKGNPRVAAMIQNGLDNHGRCTWPGCRRLHLQVDHATEWSGDDHGRTDIANANGGCGHHNRWKSRGGYTVRRDRLGHWHTYRPDGTEIRPY